MKVNQFIVAIILARLLISIGSFIPKETLDLICLAIILIAGIPHGAIDHKISLLTSKENLATFFAKYLGIMSIYALAWYFLPNASLIFFLLLSSFHFGQESLEDIGVISKKPLNMIVWGMLIIISPIAINLSEATPLINAVASFSIPALSIEMQILVGVLFALPGIVFAAIHRNYKMQSLAALLLGLYIVLPFIQAFTIFFIIFHSMNAFKHQFRWLKDKFKSYTIGNFIKDLLPFSIISMVGIMLFLLLFKPSDTIQLAAYFFMLTSILTLPHSIVFDHFYKKRNMQV